MEGKTRSFSEEVCLVAANVFQRRRCTWITDSASEGGVAAASHRGKSLIVDISQNIDRCAISTNGVCPTVTPQSILCIQAASRQVSPMDTLAMHFFPVHRMKIPTAVKAKTLQSLGQHHALEVSRIGYVHGLGDGEAVLWRWDVRGRWEV